MMMDDDDFKEKTVSTRTTNIYIYNNVLIYNNMYHKLIVGNII